MLKNVLILTVSTFSISSLSYAADTEKLSDVPVSLSLIQQPVVIEPIHFEEIVSNNITPLSLPVIEETVTQQPVVSDVPVSLSLIQQPVVIEPIHFEEIVSNNVTPLSQPVIEETVTQQPVVSDVPVSLSLIQQPVVIKPIHFEEIVSNNVTSLSQPVIEETVTQQPKEIVSNNVTPLSQPVIEETVTQQPVVSDVPVSLSLIQQPVVIEPIHFEEIVSNNVTPLSLPVIEETVNPSIVEHQKAVTPLTVHFAPTIIEPQQPSKEESSVVLPTQETVSITVPSVSAVATNLLIPTATVVPQAPKITRTQKFKKFFSKLFVCLKSTDEEVITQIIPQVEEVIQETPVIIKQVEQVAQVINEVKSITK